MIKGKEQYDTIKIPDSLSEILSDACKRAEHRNRIKRIKSFGMAAAACFVLIVLSNNQAVYASLSEVPLLGSLVQVLHFGTGGERSDGLTLHPKSAEETLRIWFDNNETQTNSVPSYQINFLEAPDRIDVTIGGIRNFEAEEFIAEAELLSSVKAAYRVIHLDDSGIRFVLELEHDIDYQVYEYKDPGCLELSFYNRSSGESRELYFLRSPAMAMGEELALLCEQYQDYDCSIVRTKESQFIAVIGTFHSQEDASSMLKELQQENDNPAPFQIDSCLNDENPD